MSDLDQRNHDFSKAMTDVQLAYIEAERRVVKLKAENERLENRLAQFALFSAVVGDPASEFASLRRELHRVESDNAKLRELVLGMWDVAVHPELFGDGSYLLKRMHEAGIEVDE